MFATVLGYHNKASNIMAYIFNACFNLAELLFFAYQLSFFSKKEVRAIFRARGQLLF